MNIAIPFIKDFPYSEEISEYMIKYDSMEDDFVDLVKFIEVYSDKRLNIELKSSANDLDSFITLTKLNPNIYFVLDYMHKDQIDDFKERELKYFFNIAANNLDLLHSLVNMSPTDIYITGELGFNLRSVKDVLNEKNIQSRAIVNLAQADDPMNSTNKLVSFFIRPEDLVYYEKYFDVAEFAYEDYPGGGLTQIEVLYKTYQKDKEWFGLLNNLILGLDEPIIDNRSILPTFPAHRVNCKKACLQGSGCGICYRIQELAEVLIDEGIIFEPESETEILTNE